MKRACLLLFLPVLALAAGKGSILAIFAHPDDETTVGPLLARYAAAGHEVHLAIITSGQKGTTPNTNLSGKELGRAREEESRCSAKALGISPPILLQYQDQGISAPRVMEEIAARLRRIIDEARPDVILTWGPEGVTGHPDHRVTSSIVTQVFQQRGLLQARPQKLYYVVFPESKLNRPPFRTVSDAFITTGVEAAAGLDAAARAIRCHKTQWNAARMQELDSMNREALGGRVFLRLAMTGAGFRETGLFEGIQTMPAGPATSVRAEHYPALKSVLREGDTVFAVCSRGGPEAVWSEAKCERALGLLGEVRDPGLQKMVVVSAIEDLQWVLARKPARLTWVAYNSERGMTPKAEFENIRASVAAFTRATHAAGLRAIWGPTHAMLQADPSLLALTRDLDGMALQHQKVLQNQGVPAFIELTRKRAREARRHHPGIYTVVQVVVGRGSREQLVEGLKAVAAEVSEIKVFSMRDTAAIASILEAVR